jgi:two-component system OmpR family response regulator
MCAQPRSPHLLVVDDDREIRTMLARLLRTHGYRVTAVGDGPSMREAIAGGRFDLVILDVMLPGEDGLSLCRDLRARDTMPILILSALGDETDRIIGLEIGADDYLAKPFNPRELVARIKAVLRRAPAEPVAQSPRCVGYRFDGWRLDLRRRELTAPDEVLVPLTAGEHDLLVAFLERPGAVLSRDQLLDLVRGRASIVFDRSIDVQVSRLRRKLGDDPANPRLIKTVRTGGYILSAPVEPIDAAEADAP